MNPSARQHFLTGFPFRALGESSFGTQTPDCAEVGLSAEAGLS